MRLLASTLPWLHPIVGPSQLEWLLQSIDWTENKRSYNSRINYMAKLVLLLYDYDGRATVARAAAGEEAEQIPLQMVPQ